MRFEGIPDMCLLIVGDWQTAISSKKYWDVLIDQRPDADMADWSVYRIPCTTTAELVAVYLEFHDRLKLHCHFSLSLVDSDVAMDLMTGYAEKNDPQCWVQVKRPTSVIEEAARKAIAILSEAIE